MRKFFTILAVCLFPLSLLYAQSSRTITGKVMDESDNPISGASVTVKGTNIGVSASTDGDFSLKIPSTAKTLLISSIGYETKEIEIGKENNFTIKLKAGSGILDEVLVVAYGQQKKTNITGSVATIKAAEIENRPFTSVDKTLQGSVAGLQSASVSGAPGSATSIRIRGIGSINADANPLWVIDGVIATTGDLSSNTATANALSGINPDDIENISVLKDAAATSIYGSRAANGVIIVTTKKGKAGKSFLNFSGEAGAVDLSYKSKQNRPLTTSESQELMREAVINAGEASTIDEADQFLINNWGLNPNYAQTNTNWLDVVTRTGTQQQYNLSLSSGTEKTQFYASAGYFGQDGTTIATDFKRYNGNLSVTHKANDRITFATGINGSSSTQRTPPAGGAYANPVLASYFLLPWYSPYNADGTPKYDDPDGEFPLSGGTFNPVVQAQFNKAKAVMTNLRGYVSGEFRILDNLTFTSRYSAEYFDIQEDEYLNPFYGDGYPTGIGTSIYRKVFNWTWTNLLDYRLNLNTNKDFYLNLTGGYESQLYKNYLLQAQGEGFPGSLALQYLESAATPTTASALPSDRATISYFAMGGLNYKDRYVLSASFRRDGSSVFGEDNKWGNFYSVGATWNANEEFFLKEIKMLSLLKFRVSYGENGNSNGFGNYASLATYSYDANYSGSPGSRPKAVGNPKLTWEKNKIFNVGVDFGLWSNRLTGTVEYYNRVTSNLLANVPLSTTSGFAVQLQNIGELSNKGIEITLGGKPIVTKNFTWDISVNFAHNKNEVTKLYGDLPVSAGQFNYTEGHDLQEYFTRIWAGADPANGDPLWYTDGTRSKTSSNISEVNRVLTGYSAAPKYYGSVNNTFTFRGISLETQIFYNAGNYVFDSWGNYTLSEGAFLGSVNQLSLQLKRWQKPGDITSVPRVIDGGNMNSYSTSTRYLYKGDYIRMRNLQLGYTFPKDLLKKIHLASAMIYIRGTNLFTIVKDKNLPFDPEKGINATSDLDVFIPRTITGGIKIGI